MNDGPDVTDEETCQQDLSDADTKGVALEIVTASVGAGGYACAEAGSEGDAVKNQADEGAGLVHGHDGLSAAVFGLLGFIHF